MRNPFEPGDLVRVINSYAVYGETLVLARLAFRGYVRTGELLLVIGGVRGEFDVVLVKVISRFGIGYVNTLALETL